MKNIDMSFGRSFVRLAGGLLLLAGCASTGNSLAHDVASDAFTHCQQRFPDWTLKRIDLDGTIWVGRVRAIWTKQVGRTASGGITPIWPPKRSRGRRHPESRRGDEWA